MNGYIRSISLTSHYSMLKFPEDFFWGAALSAYQAEGNNTNADWWEWEKRKGWEPSGVACRHYERYQEDFDLAKSLNHNAHRFSLEWSRIEPEEGKFSEEALAHYKKVILALKERGIEPIVTLHHFTNPIWFAHRGGWCAKEAPAYFLRYVEKVVQTLCKEVRFWVTINEPAVYMYFSYIVGAWPPQEKSYSKAKQVEKHFITSHVKAYNCIHGLYHTNGLPTVNVTLAMNLQAFVPCSGTLKNRFGTYLRNRFFNFGILEELVRRHSLDYLGVNYYSRKLVDVKQWGLGHLLLDECTENHHPVKTNSLGWDIYPEGLLDLLLRLQKYNLPVFILENGICTDDDNARWEFIAEHLRSLSRAMEKGVKVLGYLYWSLFDNFEWDKGFGPRFGLIEVDYHTQERKVRESARRFSQVCKTGVLDT